MATKPPSPTSTGIQLEYFILVKVDAELLQPLPSGEEPLPGDAQLGVSAAQYPGDHKRIRVELEYMLNSEYLKLYIMHRFDLVQVGADPKDYDLFWRRMVARYAPTITMPYVREMVHKLTGSMGSKGFLLPILNYETVFGADEIEIILLPAEPDKRDILAEPKHMAESGGKPRRAKAK